MTSHDPETLFGFPASAWFAFLVPLAIGALAWGGRAPARGESGWRVLRPTIGLYVIGILSAAMAVFFSGFIAIILASWPAQSLDNSSKIILLLGPPLTAMFFYSSAYLFFTNIRFNNDGVERRFLRKITFIPWSDILHIKRHFFFGPQIQSKDGRKIVVWEYWRGFRDLIKATAERGISVDIGDDVD